MFFCGTQPHIYFVIVYDCFATTAMLSNCHRDARVALSLLCNASQYTTNFSDTIIT